MSLKLHSENKPLRRDPTSFLPEEEMSYEFKKKKKKKKKIQEDPFKDLEIERKHFPEVPTFALDPEVNIKVENIEVELNFDEYADDAGNTEPLQNDIMDMEPIVKLEEQSHEGAILTFESVVNEKNVVKCSPKIKVEAETVTNDNIICQVCHLVFKSEKTLFMHQKRKHKVFRRFCKHVCDYCSMSYDSKNSLVAHIKRKHGPESVEEDNEDHTCEVCSLVFKGKSRLRMHMTRKHGKYEDSFKHVCSECGLAYEKHRSLMVHIQRKHSGVQPTSNQWFNCPFCTKIFSKRETYARHIQRKHKVSDEPNVKSENADDENLASFRNEVTGEITCKECPLMFTSINYLKLHMRRKHNALQESFQLKCRICNLSYDKLESLKRHVRRKHDIRTYCRICKKKFNSKEAYLNHSHVKFIKECSICGLIFATEVGLAKHLRRLHKIDTPKTVFCNICNQGFHEKRQLKPHLMKVHMNIRYTCKYCNKTLKTKESYRRHLILKHPTQKLVNVNLQNCSQCSESFKDEFELCKHINTVHLSNYKNIENFIEIKCEDIKEEIKDPYQCTKCAETYVTWNQLKLHFEQNHHIAEETQCQVCGEIVSTKELNKHMKAKHTELSEMKCNYCEYRTTSKVSLTQHTLRHKNATTIHCEFNGCRYKTYYPGAMEKHKRKHADLGVKFQCSQCPFQSMNKYILKYHEEAHATGKKRYMCDQCDYATILPANLVQHKYKHSTEKRFKCEVCSFATKYNTSLRFHVRKKHCDLPL